MEEEKYPFLQKYLPEWLKEQINFIQSKEWIENEQLKTEDTIQIGYTFLKKIEGLIKRFESIEGFSQWVIEAKNSRENFKHFLFELMSLENLLSKSDKLILKPHNKTSSKNPEALIIKNGTSFYAEMTFLDSLPSSIINKVDKLFDKSRKKFAGLSGIHFIGAFNFFNYPEGKEKSLPELNSLVKLIQLKFKRFGSSTLAFVLVNIYANYNPKLIDTSFPKKFIILPNPNKKLPDAFFQNLFEVDEFQFIESV